MLEIAVLSFGMSAEQLNVAFRPGSSQQGNSSRANAGFEIGRQRSVLSIRIGIIHRERNPTVAAPIGRDS